MQPNFIKVNDDIINMNHIVRVNFKPNGTEISRIDDNHFVSATVDNAGGATRVNFINDTHVRITGDKAREVYDYLKSLCIAAFDDTDEIPPQSPDFIDPTWDKRRIIGIEHKKSSSDNPTWYLTVEGVEKPLYIRQSNKDIWLEHYPELETMEIGDVAETVDITCYTKPDDDKPEFMQTVKVIAGGTLKFPELSESAKRKNEVSDELAESDDWTYIDFETTGLNPHDEIVQVGILQPDGSQYDFLVKPLVPEKLLREGKNGKTASEINGITPQMLEDAHDFPHYYEQLKSALHGKKVASYSEFDIKRLNWVCEMHNLEPIVPEQHIDLIKPIAKYIGEPGFKAGDYKWQTLENAYKTIFGVELEDAHSALADARALKSLVQTITHTNLDDIPF